MIESPGRFHVELLLRQLEGLVNLSIDDLLHSYIADMHPVANRNGYKTLIRWSDRLAFGAACHPSYPQPLHFP